MLGILITIGLVMIGTVVMIILCRIVMNTSEKISKELEKNYPEYCDDPNVWREDLDDPEG